MTASEFAFLALGLVLGIASGSALVMALGSRRPAREVRVTVGHDAVPRRAATLSSDAFTAHGEPARGGPADRRRLDRDMPAADPPPVPHGYPGIPVMRSAPEAGGPGTHHIGGLQVRTSVPFSVPTAAADPSTPTPAGAPGAPAGVGSSAPDRDPSLDALRVQAVLAAEHALREGLPTAIALLESRPVAGPAPAETHPAEQATGDSVDPAPGVELDDTPAIIRILRGDQRALLRTVAILARGDDAMRRLWQSAITALADALVQRAIVRGVLDFPVGNPFWDSFPTSQCRTIAASLAAMGFRFDGVDGWADGRVPIYRDLTIAVAAAGLDPRRIRAWPTQDEIAALYREVTTAADELVMTEARDLDLASVQELAWSRLADVELAWRLWEIVRPVLAGPVRPA